MKQWSLLTKESETATKRQNDGATSLLGAVLSARHGIYDSTPEENGPFFDPYLLHGMDAAVLRIREAVEQGERICIFGDYDCDGITSVAVLYDYLRNIGADLVYYLPQREAEGYGMNKTALTDIAKWGVTLIITVDNGISAGPEILFAKSLGIDVIVTDHHSPGEVLPACVAVINPHTQAGEQDIFVDLAGVGVVFKLICALEEDDGHGVLEYYADLLAVGTIADLVLLTGENRMIARYGLAMLGQTENVGLLALLEQCGLADKPIDETSVAFYIAPRLNAAGRVGDAALALDLLLCEEEETAAQLAQELAQMHTMRQTIEEEILKQAARLLKEDPAILYQRIILLKGSGWHNGVSGIIAAKITERYGKPCIILNEENGEIRGSGRSVEGFDLISCIRLCADFFTKYGGHPMAVGFSMQRDKYEMFNQTLQNAAKTTAEKMPNLTLTIDSTAQAQHITLPALEELSRLKPFGTGNPAPLFLLENCRVDEIIPIGGGKHLRLKLSQESVSFSAVYFGATTASFYYTANDAVDIAVSCSVGEYQGKKTADIFVKDIRFTQFCQQEYFDGKAQYEAYLLNEPIKKLPKQALPDRDMLAFVFRGVKALAPYEGTFESLYCRLAYQYKAAPNYCAFRLGYDILEEIAVLQRADGRGKSIFSAQTVQDKKELSQSKIYQKIAELEG